MRKIIPVIVFLFLLVACQTATPDTSGNGSISLDDGAVVAFARRGGIDGRTTEWRLYPDGQVTITSGEEEAQVSVPPGRVEDILAELENAGFFDLSGDYMPEDACCDRFHYRLAAKRAGQTNTIETVEATQEIPLTVWQSIGVLEKFIFQEINQGTS